MIQTVSTAMAGQGGEGDGLLTKKQAAKWLKVCERTVTSLIASGKLRAVKFDRAVRIDPDDLRAFVDASKK